MRHLVAALLGCWITATALPTLGQAPAYNPMSRHVSIDLTAVDTESPHLHIARFGDFDVSLAGYLETSIIDSDIRALGHSIALSASDPSLPGTSAFGVGGISVQNGLMTKIKFAYGNRGDQHFNPVFGVLGGFTSLAINRSFGYQAYDDGIVPAGGASNTRGDVLLAPPSVVPHTDGGIYRQFAVDAGQDAGPRTLSPVYRWQGPSGDIPVSNTFNRFIWTNGTSFGNPNSGPTRPAKAQIAGIEVDVISFEDILRNSVVQDTTAGPYTMALNFAPKVDGAAISLPELANAMGFDHFNWYQQVTAAPSKSVPVIATRGPTGAPVSAGITAAQLKTHHESLANSLSTSVDPVTKAPLTKTHVGLGLVDAIPQTESAELMYLWTRPDIPNSYVVQSGDTLSQIAEKFDVSTDYLARRNSITDLDLIFAGQNLSIKPPGAEPGWQQPWADVSPTYSFEDELSARPFVDPSQTYGPGITSTIEDYELDPIYPGSELDTRLNFNDSPANAYLDRSSLSEAFAFRTELVGVEVDGSLRFLADEFPGLGMAWEWKSNTEIDPDAPPEIGGRVFDVRSAGQMNFANIAPYVIGGGIFDVGSDLIAVPEPNGVRLAFVLIGYALNFSRRIAVPRSLPKLEPIRQLN